MKPDIKEQILYDSTYINNLIIVKSERHQVEDKLQGVGMRGRKREWGVMAEWAQVQFGMTENALGMDRQ